MLTRHSFIRLQKDAKGADLLDRVFEYLNVVEKEYFSLQFMPANKTEKVFYNTSYPWTYLLSSPSFIATCTAIVTGQTRCSCYNLDSQLYLHSCFLYLRISFNLSLAILHRCRCGCRIILLYQSLNHAFLRLQTRPTCCRKLVQTLTFQRCRTLHQLWPVCYHLMHVCFECRVVELSLLTSGRISHSMDTLFCGIISVLSPDLSII